MAAPRRPAVARASILARSAPSIPYRSRRLSFFHASTPMSNTARRAPPIESIAPSGARCTCTTTTVRPSAGRRAAASVRISKRRRLPRAVKNAVPAGTPADSLPSRAQTESDAGPTSRTSARDTCRDSSEMPSAPSTAGVSTRKRGSGDKMTTASYEHVFVGGGHALADAVPLESLTGECGAALAHRGGGRRIVDETANSIGNCQRGLLHPMSAAAYFDLGPRTRARRHHGHTGRHRLDDGEPEAFQIGRASWR